MKKFAIVDAGCRLGPSEDWLKMDAEIIGFDPDPEECNRLEAEFPGHRFIPLALDSESRKRHFWITENPECGSFYRPDQGMLLKGFAFWGFKNLNYRKGQLIWGDAYYFKPPNEGRTLELGTAIGCHP